MVDADEVELSGVLHIYVHLARNIHNICIYDDQDVYAKFSLTCDPDEVLSTRTVHGGGRNPDFNEGLQIKIVQLDAVLKCEIWMHSRNANYLEDQLLGFVLVPLSSVIGKGKLTRDFTLSSTDLFHSPAGFVQLTLFFENSAHPFPQLNSPADSTEVVLHDPKDQNLDHCEYEKFEFPDVKITTENQRMVFEYFDMAKKNHASVLNFNANGLVTMPFLQIGASPQTVDEYDMAADSTGKICESSPEPPQVGAVETGNHVPDAGLLGCITTSLSLDGSMEKRNDSGASTDVVDSKNEDSKIDDPVAKVGAIKLGSIFTNPLEEINLGPHQMVVQQQIVDMYMKSMQQFTESLAKMELPTDFNRLGPEGGGEIIQRQSNLDKENKGSSTRVFYGSRAFF
ncbi:uncharacterized protein LOC116250547 [Nymphaea colorata]|nr:uncharacterized protein LOC116250547 [Nymphaea colorata]XP_031480121.1 uncharacterized protein LOC116250547 [Nymphaea colorata]